MAEELDGSGPRVRSGGLVGGVVGEAGRKQARGQLRYEVTQAVPGIGVVQDGVPVRVAVLAQPGPGRPAYGSGRPASSQAGPPGGWLPAITFPGTVPTTPCTASAAWIAVSIAASLPRDMPSTASRAPGSSSCKIARAEKKYSREMARSWS